MVQIVILQEKLLAETELTNKEELPDGAEDNIESSSEKPFIASGEQTAESMEVHHHPHLPHGEKKKLNEYFLEFLMIFLAVTMGFIAENLREHISDRSKESEYVISYIEGLKSDTANLKHVIDFGNKVNTGLDSIITMSRKNMSDITNQRLFYTFAYRYLFQYTVFKSDDYVMQQLKNSGGLRLIEKDHVADSLSSYDASTEGTYSQADVYINVFKDIVNIEQEMLDFTLLTDTSYIKNFTPTQKQLPLFAVDPAKMKLFFNKVVSLKFITYFYDNQLLQTQLQFANRLILFLQKEYGLKEE